MKLVLSEKQLTFIDYMTKGYGLDAAPKELSRKERIELDQLVEHKLAYYQKRPMACYHIPTEERDRIKGLVAAKQAGSSLCKKS